MKRGTYLALAELCGRHLLGKMPEPVPPQPEFMPEVSCAVYAVADQHGNICYVGSVCRPGDLRGLANHVSEYLHTLEKVRIWDQVYIFPLRADTSETDVRSLGGEIAGWLLPYDRERWPVVVSP
ncbi:hypothetical protein [Sinosporangium siamense]|uniref:Uncharacterized protein n=1 Tax=Sinosporangium siamense TaxID=1367973 RepID=A0A919VAI4_9ACTN|nr:hypothetical protein [Sinosporangium siamense]GII91144.1 hypothetical protein Ssi02_13750 [Sinosporangium siamense]